MCTINSEMIARFLAFWYHKYAVFHVNFNWSWHGFQQTENPCLHFHLGFKQWTITCVYNAFLAGDIKEVFRSPVNRDTLSAVWSVNFGERFNKINAKHARELRCEIA